MDNIVENMKKLATKWHEGQFRRGSEHLSYIVHPAAVVAKLREWGYSDQDDAVTLAVAWGHDLLEETKCPEADIVAAGGAEVLAGIKMLSFTPEGLTDTEYDNQKKTYIFRIAEKAAPEILVVKIADRICNTLDFVHANDKWGVTYLDLGACLFDRLAEMKFAQRIRAEVQCVQALVKGM